MPLPIDYHNHPAGPQHQALHAGVAAAVGRQRARKRASRKSASPITTAITRKASNFDQIDRLNTGRTQICFSWRASSSTTIRRPATAGRAWVEKNWDRSSTSCSAPRIICRQDDGMFDQDDAQARSSPNAIFAADCATYVAELNGMIDRGGIDCLSHLDLIKIHGVWKPEGGLAPLFPPAARAHRACRAWPSKSARRAGASRSASNTRTSISSASRRNWAFRSRWPATRIRTRNWRKYYDRLAKILAGAGHSRGRLVSPPQADADTDRFGLRTRLTSGARPRNRGCDCCFVINTW